MNESASKKPETKSPLLAFDGDCRLCVGSIRGLEKWGLLGELETCAATLVTGTDREFLDRHRRAGEIVLLKNNRSEALTGAAAFRWILQRRFPGFLTRALDFLPIYLVMTLGYRLIASWRRIVLPPLATPDPLFPEPGWVVAFRATLSVVFLLLAPVWVTLLHQKLGIGNGFDSLLPVGGEAPPFLFVTALIVSNALLTRLLGFRRPAPDNSRQGHDISSLIPGDKCLHPCKGHREFPSAFRWESGRGQRPLYRTVHP